MANPTQSGLEKRLRPFAAFISLGSSGKRFNAKRNTTKLFLDGPQYLIEQTLRIVAEKGHHAFKESTYYQPIVESTPCQTTVWMWKQILSKSCDVVIDFPKNSDQVVAWVKRTTERHPNSRIYQMTHRQIERYEQCDDLEFVQGAVRKTESVFRFIAWVDPSEFTSSVVLMMQDVEDVTFELRSFIELRKRIYQAIGNAPEKLIGATYGSPERNTYGSPEKKRNHFARHFSPLAFKTAAAIKPKEKALEEYREFSNKVQITCKSVEKASFHVFFPEAVHTALPKVGRFFGRHVIRWYICDATGWIVASGVQHIQRMAGYEEEDLAHQETIVTTHWYAKWALWTLMLNFELKTWKVERERVPQDIRDLANDYGNKIRTKLAQNLGVQEGFLGKIASYALPFVQENIEPQQIQPHQPPPITIWRRGWNTVSRWWRDCFKRRHPHQE